MMATHHVAPFLYLGVYFHSVFWYIIYVGVIRPQLPYLGFRKGKGIDMSSLNSTNAYDYINVLDKAADAAWTRNQLIADNIANASTPGYKRKDINFEETLKKAMGASRFTSTDEKIATLRNKELNAKVYEDEFLYSYRMDGNNVDPDTENVYLAENTVRYNGLQAAIDQEFKNLRSVMK